jgi:hypothetical protein
MGDHRRVGADDAGDAEGDGVGLFGQPVQVVALLGGHLRRDPPGRPVHGR